MKAKITLLSVLTLAAMVAGPAMAADMPVKAPLPPLAVWNWTGFYVGGNYGGGWGRKDWTDMDALPFTNTPVPNPVGSSQISGTLGGFQVGANWQAGWAVIGVEAMFDWSNLKATTRTPQALSAFQ